MSETAVFSPAVQPRFSALIPFFVFLLFYCGLSLWCGDFYLVPMPLAFLIASAAAMLLDRKRPLADRVENYAAGMGDSNIMLMCLIFILAGAFAASAKAMGAVDATVLIARHLIPDRLMLTGVFLVSCFISLAVGTSCGTIAALTPIAIGLTAESGASPSWMVGAVIGGAMFGDNLSMISDTTIAATRTQGVAMRDKFLMNLKISLPAAAAALVLYTAVGRAGTGVAELPPVSGKTFCAVVPYLGILVGALAGWNVMVLLFLGTVLAIAIGLFNGSFTFFQALPATGRGVLDMAETLIVAILAGGLLGVIRRNGGIAWLLNRIEMPAAGPRGCEFGIALLTGSVNLVTANNTVAIVVVGPIARELSEKYHCDHRRIASILDTASCVVQGLIPYGAQVLIAVGIARGMNHPVEPLELTSVLYYPMFLGLALLGSILFAGLRRGK